MDLMSRSFSHLSSYSTGLSPTMSQSLSQQLDLLGGEPDSLRWGEGGHLWDEANPPVTLKKVRLVMERPCLWCWLMVSYSMVEFIWFSLVLRWCKLYYLLFVYIHLFISSHW